MLDGQILGRWFFVLDGTRGVKSYAPLPLNEHGIQQPVKLEKQRRTFKTSHVPRSNIMRYRLFLVLWPDIILPRPSVTQSDRGRGGGKGRGWKGKKYVRGWAHWY